MLVTGAAGGIGTALVEHLSERRCSVAAVDLRFDGWSPASRPGVHVLEADLAAPRAAAVVDQAAGRLGRLDAVVHAAAILDNIHRAHRFAQEAWDREMTVNLDAAFRVVQAAHPHLVAAGGGRIVVISSMAAELGQPGQVAYAASKAGLLGMMRTLAVEWAADAITVNAVVPGVIETPKVLRLPAAVRDAYRERIPLGRFAEPAELAGVVAFLLSPASAYLTGTAIRVDGGFGLNTLSLAAGSRRGAG